MREVLLSAEEIVKTYPGAQEPVLKSVSAEIYQGDFTIIMGPSGAGKSTLLYALSGMDALSSGKVLFENVAVAGYLEKGQSEKAVNERAEALLAQMHVERAKDRLPSQASGGEAQRAAIARAMMNRPGLLFADEPTGALNRKNSEEVLDLLTSLNQEGQSILMVTHDVKAAIRGTRILYLEDGIILDDISLPPFDAQTAREREEKVSAWLASLSW